MRESLYQKITADMAARLQLRRIFFGALFLSLCANVALSVHVLMRVDTTRTIVITPDAPAPYIAMDDAVSANLLERFCVGALNLVLNMTPQTADWQIQEFLKHVAAESYAPLRAQLREQVGEFKRTQASSAFFAQASAVDTEAKTVCLTGERRIMIAQTVTKNEPLTACVQTQVRLGRIWIARLSMQPAPSRSSTQPLVEQH